MIASSLRPCMTSHRGEYGRSGAMKATKVAVKIEHRNGNRHANEELIRVEPCKRHPQRQPFKSLSTLIGS